MIDKRKLRAKMEQFGDTAGRLAEAIGISQQTFSKKINNKNADFTAAEIRAIRERYHLSNCEVMSIFFG